MHVRAIHEFPTMYCLPFCPFPPLQLHSNNPTPAAGLGKTQPIKQINPWDDIVNCVKEQNTDDAGIDTTDSAKTVKSIGETWLESTASSLLIDTAPTKVSSSRLVFLR